MEIKNKTLISLFAIANLLLPSMANIIVDPTAAINFQPDISSLNASTTQINIVNPDTAGLSHNKYQEFDVIDQNDQIIFNNSLVGGNSLIDPTLSLLSNPNLSQTARIILNEVTGSGVSNLNGQFEIFGDKAALVFANPNGISVGGGKFFNVANLTMIAGNAIIDPAGDLTVTNTADLNLAGISAQNINQANFYGVNINNTERFDIETERASATNSHAWDIRDGRIVFNADDTITNSNASIETNGDLIFNADKLRNERTGYYTEYIPKHWASGVYQPEYHRVEWQACCNDPYNTEWEYWIHRDPGTPEARILSVGDITLNVRDTEIDSGLILAGNDFTVNGETFSNRARSLLVVSSVWWYYSNTYNIVEGPYLGGQIASTTEALGDAILNLSGNLHNTGDIRAGETLFINASNQPTPPPLTTQQISPPVAVLPSLFSPFLGNTNLFAFRGPNITPPPPAPPEPDIASTIATNVRNEEKRISKYAINNEGLLEGNNIYVQSEDVNNAGEINANYLALQADSLLNQRLTDTQITTVLEGSKYRNINYKQLRKEGGEINVNSADINIAGDLTNQGGQINADSILNLNAENITNKVVEGQTVNRWDYETFFGKRKGGWAYGSDLLAAEINAGELNLNASNEIKNIGSDIYADSDINLFADNLIEQDWVARANLIENSRGGFLNLDKTVRWEHVTSRSSIAAGDNLNIETNQTFRSNASTLAAGQDINVNANDIDISDDYIQSVNETRRFSLGLSGPTVSATLAETDSTITTHGNSEVIAGGDINLSANKNLDITGTNTIAEGNINAIAENIDIEAGRYTDTTKTKGITASISPGVGTITAGITAFGADGEYETITQSNLQGENINLSANKIDIHSSTAEANNELNIDTDSLTATGEYQTNKTDNWSAGVSATAGFNPIQGSYDVASIGVSGSVGESEEGKYIASLLTGAETNINANNTKYDGAVIDGQSHGVKEDYSNNSEHHGGIGIGATGVVTGSYGQGDWTGTVGTNNIGASYKDYGAGANWNENRAGVTVSVHGVDTGLTRTINNEGITNDHPVYEVAAQYGPLGVQGSLQHGKLKSITPQLLHLQKELEIAAKDKICFEEDTLIETKGKGKLKIIDIAIGDLVKSYDESSQSIVWKKVLAIHQNHSTERLYLTLSNDTVLKLTPQHRLYVNGKWIEAGAVLINDKLLDDNLNQVYVTEIEKVATPKVVYNLSIEHTHNYFANGVLAHNDCKIINANGEEETIGMQEFLQRKKQGEQFEVLSINVPNEDNPDNPLVQQWQEYKKTGQVSKLNNGTSGDLIEFLQSESGAEFLEAAKSQQISNNLELSTLLLGMGSIVRSMGGNSKAYLSAKNGGYLSGEHKALQKLSDSEILKNITSLNKQIQIHLNKIKNIDKLVKVPKSSSYYKTIRQATLKGWRSEIKQMRDKIDVAKGVLHER